MPLDLLTDLIAIPSVNPMGRPMDGPELYEAGMSDYLVQFFQQLELPCETFEVKPGRANVVAKLEGSPDAPTILLDAHQDTVPVDDMTISPFEPSIQEGRIYGRGACDVKGGMAAMLSALVRLKQEPQYRRPTVIMACTCDEELNQSGAKDLTGLFQHPEKCQSQLLSTKPDMVIVAEPTDLDIVVAHRGATRWKIKTKGVAAHSSDPSQGENAIYRMARVVRALEQYAERLHFESIPHPLCGVSTLSVGRIDGGISVNMVPPECTIEIDRRVVPGEDGFDVIQQIDDYLRAHIDVDFQMLPPWTIGIPLSDAENMELAERIQNAAKSVSHDSQIVGAGYGTHAARYAQSVAPSVVFGPGSIKQAHTKDEWLDIGELEKAVEILQSFLVANW